MKTLTPYMKTTLLDLYEVVLRYDGGKPLQTHDVKDVHHKILKGLADDSRKLIILEASNSPTGIIWTVALTPKGLREAKKLAKDAGVINATAITSTRKRKTIQVQLHEVKQAGVIKAIQVMKDTKGLSYTRFVIQSVAMDSELKAGQFELFKQLYPEAYANILMSEMLQEWKRYADTPQPASTRPARDLQPDSGIRALNVNTDVPMPIFEDDDSDLLPVAASTIDRKQVAQNFINSALGLQEKKEE